MESITTARTLTFEELKANDYRRQQRRGEDEGNAEYVNVNANDIHVGDYIWYYANKRGAWGDPIIGRVSRRTAKTIWFNPLRKNCDDNLVMNIATHNATYHYWFHYWNISENINLEPIEKKTTANNRELRKIPQNFIIETYIDYMR